MKRLIQITLLLILLPTITILILNHPIKQQKKYNIEKNITIRVKRQEKNTIETIPLEQYLIGVLAGEMPVSYEIEALKAQAVAARTYALNKMEINKENTYDIVDTTDDQVYLDQNKLKENWGNNYEENLKKIKQAIQETTGEYITFDGKIIKAFFFSTSSGATENCKDVFGSDIPYLVSVASTWDETSPSYKDERIYTKKEFLKQLELPYNENIEIKIERNKTNSIKTITINDVTFKGTEFRKKLNLKSTNLEIEQIENQIKINSKGYGHGVGMSQYGAKQLAREGYKYNEIIKYYYQGTEIKKI